jgi:5-methylcytosine-specific restriction endonuclease McrA
VAAATFAEFLVHGPAGEPTAEAKADFGKYLKFRKQCGIHPGSNADWMGATAQKTPRFDNRIVQACALIPRLQVCRIAPRWRATANGQKQIDPRSLLAAEVVFLLQLKNVQVDDPNESLLRFLKPSELTELLEFVRNETNAVPIADGWERKVLDCFKITKARWNKWCREKNLQPINTESSDNQSEQEPASETSHDVAAATAPENTATKQARSKSNDVVKAPKPTGRSRFCRPALAILRHLLTHDEKPTGFTERLRKQDKELLNELGFELLNSEPRRTPMKHRQQKRRERPWLLLDDLDFLDLAWKAKDEQGKPRQYSPHDLRIPDMALRHLRKKHSLTQTPFSELVHRADPELKRREQAISDLIGEQNNPIVRERLTRYWKRLQHFQNPTISPDAKKQKAGFGLTEPECLVLEFVRDDKDNSFDGQKRLETYQEVLRRNEDRRERARKALEASKLPTSDEMIVRWMLLEDQGPFCIYTSNAISCCDLANQTIQIEHIVPRALGGPDAYWNWALCTEEANAQKSNRIPYNWFREEKTDGEWAEYKRRVLDRASKLGRRKVDLLLRADACELVGEKYTSLAATAWIARLAQSVARLHFGWPLDDEREKERVIAISGGLTARIRRKYLLDSLLGSDEDAVKLRKDIDDTLAELDGLKADTSLGEMARKQKRADLRQKLQALASESGKNRDDQRHHALDAMVLSFLPNWARDRNKQDFFRFDEVGDNALYSEEGLKEVTLARKRIQQLAAETAPIRERIKAAKETGKWDEMQRLKDGIFPQRKEMAQCFQFLDKRKQPRNIRAVRDWFRQQLEVESPVLPRSVAFKKTPVEDTLYRRAYLIDRNHVELSRIPLIELGLRPDFHDVTRCLFDLKWLHTRIQSITDHADYDRNKLKAALDDKLKVACVSCCAKGRAFGDGDWRAIATQPDVQGLFRNGNSKRTATDPAECKVKVFQVALLPAKRYPLSDLAYGTGNVYVWNPDYFDDTTGKIVRKLDSSPRGRGRRQIRQAIASQPHPDALPWDNWKNFAWDRETQANVKTLRQQLEQELAPLLPGPKPKGMTASETEIWDEKQQAFKDALDKFRQEHKLPKALFLFTWQTDRPPKKPLALLRVLFERKDRVFSAHILQKRADKIVDQTLGNYFGWFADSLFQIPGGIQQESLWKEFCAVARTVDKQRVAEFVGSNSNLSARQWIDFLKRQSGPGVTQIQRTVGENLEEYCDLSKDGTGQFVRGGNRGYLICTKADRIQAFPIRFFQSKTLVREWLTGNKWELADSQIWRSGDLLRLSKPAGTTKKTVQPNYYFLGSFSNNGKTVNLNVCFGGDVPQGISLKSLWEAGLRREE